MKNTEKQKPAQDGIFVPLGFTEEIDLGLSPEQVGETSEGNIGDLPVVEEISNDLESFFSSEIDPEEKPKREYNPNNQLSFRPFSSDTSEPVSPTTATPLKSHILPEDIQPQLQLQPQIQLDNDFYNYPSVSVTPTPLADLILQEQPELSEESPAVPHRRQTQAFLGHQIPILSQTTEMNQDQAHSFVFE